MIKTLSESAVSTLTGVDRAVVKRRLSRLKPCGRNGNGPLYDAPSAIQAVFDYYSDAQILNSRKLAADTARAELDALEAFREKVPSQYVATALSYLIGILKLHGVPERKHDAIL